MGFVGLIFFVIVAILLRTLGGAVDNKNATGDPDWKNASKRAYNRTMWGWGHEDGPDGCQKAGCSIFIIIIIIIVVLFFSLISSMSG